MSMTEQNRHGDDEVHRGYQPEWNSPPEWNSSNGPAAHLPPLPPSAPHLGQQGEPQQQARPGSGYGVYGPPQPSPYVDAYGRPSYYPVPAAPKVLSIASLCCGIAAFMGFGFFLLPQLAAVVLGHLALNREPAGKGLAIAGLVLGYVAIAITVLVVVVLGVAFSNAEFVSAR
jgi:hypothetical protein